MKFLKQYLLVSSVILHLTIIISLFWVVPLFTHAMEADKSWAESANKNKSETGVVKDVSEIVRGKLKYKGYLVSYKDKNLYVMGNDLDKIKKGDVVNVMIDEHPFSPLKSLIVTVSKN